MRAPLRPVHVSRAGPVNWASSLCQSPFSSRANAFRFTLLGIRAVSKISIILLSYSNVREADIYRRKVSQHCQPLISSVFKVYSNKTLAKRLLELKERLRHFCWCLTCLTLMVAQTAGAQTAYSCLVLIEYA